MSSIYKKTTGIVTLSLFGSTLSYGQGSFFNSEEFVMYVILGLTVIIALLALAVAFYVLHILKIIISTTALKKSKSGEEAQVAEPGWWSKFNQKMTGAVPIEEEDTIDLKHSYDGIRELDNHLPPWWKYLFYLSIVFAIVYLFAYHITGSLPLQEKEYENEMLAAAEYKASIQPAAGELIDENTIEFSDDPDVLASGKKVYEMQCIACHKSLGEGGIGPNLTDEFWIHGGSAKDIFKTVRYGVPDKGMIAWESVLSLSKIKDVTMYINTLKGTNPPNAKAPQGELYKGE